MNINQPFNTNLADAFCTGLMMGHDDDANVLLNLSTFPHHLLIEKFADAVLENNIVLMNKLYETGLIDLNEYCRDGETLLTLALKNRIAYTGNPFALINDRETNTETVTLQTIETLLAYPEIDAGKVNKRAQAPIVLAITPSDIRVFMTLIPRPDIDVNVANSWGKTLLMELVQQTGGAAANMLQATLARPELDKNATTDNGTTAAMMMGHNDDSNIVNIFLASGGINLSHVNTYGTTALKAASEKPHNFNAIKAFMNLNP
jgi:hypothetical protein